MKGNISQWAKLGKKRSQAVFLLRAKTPTPKIAARCAMLHGGPKKPSTIPLR
jgi:hypothetical protein